MKKITFIAILLLLALISSCTQTSSNKITNKKEYQKYLVSSNNIKLKNQTENLLFWENKFKNTPSQYPYLSKIASVNSQLFSTTGNIDFLIKAEKSLLELNKKKETSSSLRALARNYISQHRFKESLELLKKAEVYGDNLNATQKMLFDVQLELGNYEKAEAYLSSIKQLNDFDYLIRASKWNDTKGNLKTAISLLENALHIVKSRNDKDLLLWTYTNLGDFYGHNNQIKKSYEFYLKSLEIDPSNAYAKKGIAWIVYSYEKNPTEALHIISEIQKTNQSPDYYLLASEIEEYRGNNLGKNYNLQKYLSLINNEKFGIMYTMYEAEIHADYETTIDKSIELANQEIKSRPTAKSYDLLAWATIQKGFKKEALAIVDKHVKGKTFEPSVLYHIAEIYKANGFTKEANKLKNELLEASYELGPLMTLKIQSI
tara:strand:+ start:34390 stop:35679 length:1290 start_codon:yes stop_codon:yes gene_type:complete